MCACDDGFVWRALRRRCTANRLLCSLRRALRRGDPLKGEVYGWAACANGGAILTLRNPHSAIRAFELEPTHVFDIWDHTAWPPSFTLSSPYADQRVQGVTVHLGRASLVELQPFEVMVLEYHRGL